MAESESKMEQGNPPNDGEVEFEAEVNKNESFVAPPPTQGQSQISGEIQIPGPSSRACMTWSPSPPLLQPQPEESSQQATAASTGGQMQDAEDLKDFEGRKICCFRFRGGSRTIWHLKYFVLTSLAGFFLVMPTVLYGTWQTLPHGWCTLIDLPDHKGLNGGLHLSTPQETLAGLSKSKCGHFPFHYKTVNNVPAHYNLTAKAFSCPGPVPKYNSPNVTDWPSKLCTKSPWTFLHQVVFMLGLLIGIPLSARFAESAGRQSTISNSALVCAMAGFSSFLLPGFGTVLFARFVQGFFAAGVYPVSFILAMETIPESWHVIASSYFHLPIAFCYTFIPIIDHYLGQWVDWMMLQFLTSSLSFALAFTVLLVPESPRWLVGKGRLTEAEQILNKAPADAQTLSRKFPTLLRCIDQGRKEVPFLSELGRTLKTLSDLIFRSKATHFRFRFLTLCLCWGYIRLTYYGLVLNSSNVNTSLFHYLLFSGLLEFPAYLLTPHLIRVCGRRPILVGLVTLAGIVLLASLLLSGGVTTFLVLTGKLLVGSAFAMIYIYSFELMPTPVRYCSLGIFFMVATAGAAIAPIIVEVLPGLIRPSLPCIIFGALSLLTGALAFFLPETANRPMPQTVEEMEETPSPTQDETDRIVTVA